MVSPIARTLAILKKSPELFPVTALTIGGLTLACLGLLRAALYSQDVSFNRRKNPEPHQYWRDKQAKLIDRAFQHVSVSPAPEF